MPRQPKKIILSEKEIKFAESLPEIPAVQRMRDLGEWRKKVNRSADKYKRIGK